MKLAMANTSRIDYHQLSFLSRQGFFQKINGLQKVTLEKYTTKWQRYVHSLWTGNRNRSIIACSKTIDSHFRYLDPHAIPS